MPEYRTTYYDRDCPRCGSDTEVWDNGRARECLNDSCPWDVIKGGH